ncbi:MAG TPA: nucleotidyltransferase family protein [Pyrinomonadaceae bacterium]|nr:nucleotidyltransferase family protein [Pyrinomonadaceae bacterium]
MKIAARHKRVWRATLEWKYIQLLVLKGRKAFARLKSPLLFDTNTLIELCRKNDVAKLAVFGSMARGEANDQSDIDLLVEFSKRESLLALVSLERKMSAAIGRKIDLLTEAAISPYVRDRIKRDLRVI